MCGNMTRKCISVGDEAKVLSGMDIAKKRVPQDGHFKEVIDGICWMRGPACPDDLWREDGAETPEYENGDRSWQNLWNA